jgi:hypothetical protein
MAGLYFRRRKGKGEREIAIIIRRVEEEEY